jgi:hypothetical protein
MIRAAVLLLVAVSFGSGCGFDDKETLVETPPLRVTPQGTVPADSTEYLFDADGLDLVATFNREVATDDVPHLQLVPRPAAVGAILNPAPNPRQIVLESVVLDPIYTTYRLVLDGPAMPGPDIVTYYSAQRTAFEGSMQGNVRISRGNTEPEDVLVYALVPPGLEEDFPLTGSEETILGRPVLGVTRSVLVLGEEGGWYRLAGLDSGRRYLVLAILDTTGDGIYDLAEDWWGYWRDEVDAALEVVAGVPFGGQLEPPQPEMRTDIEFWLLEPGALNPTF